MAPELLYILHRVIKYFQTVSTQRSIVFHLNLVCHSIFCNFLVLGVLLCLLSSSDSGCGCLLVIFVYVFWLLLHLYVFLHDHRCSCLLFADSRCCVSIVIKMQYLVGSYKILYTLISTCMHMHNNRPQFLVKFHPLLYFSIITMLIFAVENSELCLHMLWHTTQCNTYWSTN